MFEAVQKETIILTNEKQGCKPHWQQPCLTKTDCLELNDLISSHKLNEYTELSYFKDRYRPKA
ncbi:hypothetical protein [Agarivorans sp. Alg241-V36]|uniref:hypothetical protein n=1 Tax=Agarivorans sp. Alg241-V36 TaxID=2305992 RepID=UPI0013D7445A|nr:hypothetical protein [Agarivorans sp. Alg241-V36]